MSLWKEVRELSGKLRREEFIFVLLVVMVVLGLAFPVIKPWEGAGQVVALVTLMCAVVGLALGALWLHYRQAERDAARKDEIEKQHANLTAQIAQLGGQLNDLRIPPIKVINRFDYPALLKTWNDAGVGRLLLFNIELQTFRDEAAFKATWGNISELANIQSVELLLPPDKIELWEGIVKTYTTPSDSPTGDKFFDQPKNRKFNATRFIPSTTDPHTIGFAFYQIEDAGREAVHDTALVFILAQPFADLRETKLLNDTRVLGRWWDYRHVLQFHREKTVIESLRQLWNTLHDPSAGRDVARILNDIRPLQPIEPAALLNLLKADATRTKELLALLSERPVAMDGDPTKIDVQDAQPNGTPEIVFTIEYDNRDKIRGRCLGADRDDKPAVVWVGGFTENEESTLPNLFSKVLAKEDIVQFHYRNSSPTRDITLTRYAQDMRAVIDYARRQRVVDEDRIVLVARSINGLIAAHVAADATFGKKITAGLVLVAPVFDMIEMIDAYRSRYGEGAREVRFEDCWRHKPGCTAQMWEDEERGWMQFYGQHLSLGLFADIIRQPRDRYSLDSTVKAIGRVSETRPVYILSHPDDPVVGSAQAIDALKQGVADGIINEDNFRFIPIESTHDLAKQMEGFFSIRKELEETKGAMREILEALRLPVLPDESMPGGGRTQKTSGKKVR